MPKITLDHSHILSNDVGTIWERSTEGHLLKMKIFNFLMVSSEFPLIPVVYPVIHAVSAYEVLVISIENPIEILENQLFSFSGGVPR